MSYVLRAVVIDLPKLSAAIGSGDQQLIASVKALDPERYEEDEDWDAEEEGEISLSQAVEDLILGNPPA
ncbi:hypothetical protein [Blastopirellula marina]|uniref:DUF7691 domain-containing protein n=1 Tax=Blastopirellula marina TaxID=124 RepID=A0A2S8GD40_9BACT|nr:hypothetical protein [Blastopirellula marina]PQO42343.1 hypothetical protein C5Y93_28825 [Blastopirellula marina]